MATNKQDQATTAPPAPQESGLKFFREILGQDWVVSHLKSAMLGGRLSHAYLFLGPGGVGKAATARALAAALNCAQPGADGDACGTCPSCRRMQAGTHPDFLVISTEEGKTQIKIEVIRELRRLTEYPPLGGGWRVVLIKPAEALTAQSDAAANALLKPWRSRLPNTCWCSPPGAKPTFCPPSCPGATSWPLRRCRRP